MRKDKYARLKVLMFEKGLTQAQVAEKAGMNKTTLNRKLSEHEDFWISEVEKLCKALGIPDNKIGYYFFL